MFFIFSSSSSSCIKTNVNEDNLSNPDNRILSNFCSTETSKSVLCIEPEEINDIPCLNILDNDRLLKTMY